MRQKPQGTHQKYRKQPRILYFSHATESLRASSGSHLLSLTRRQEQHRRRVGTPSLAQKPRAVATDLPVVTLRHRVGSVISHHVEQVVAEPLNSSTPQQLPRLRNHPVNGQRSAQPTTYNKDSNPNIALLHFPSQEQILFLPPSENRKGGKSSGVEVLCVFCHIKN